MYIELNSVLLYLAREAIASHLQLICTVVFMKQSLQLFLLVQQQSRQARG